MLVPILCVEDERHGMAWERLLVLRLVVVVCVMCGLDLAIACQRVLEAASRCRKNPEMKSRELHNDSSSGVVGKAWYGMGKAFGAQASGLCVCDVRA